ncbi:hypothetical protein BFJ63_vAg5836 [Fusarium oxysporum f. sp. narcissi]|uniref:Uncharacterized protein n=1 Tax=Fusarium oxysporum f. sp. narcissi TaxID=451672 RepID=A0A4Q2VYD4_FUSOX|nr:hypothetical protein BFJ63_vAg5836 [Fusarium oxysporum f. sp. narcissi]
MKASVIYGLAALFDYIVEHKCNMYRTGTTHERIVSAKDCAALCQAAGVESRRHVYMTKVEIGDPFVEPDPFAETDAEAKEACLASEAALESELAECKATAAA